MKEFNVIYALGDQHYFATVFAPARPESLYFSSYDQLREAMDELGHEWRLRQDMPVSLPVDDPAGYAAWLEQFAKLRALEAKPRESSHLTAPDNPSVS